ncbi:hypothetical protein NDU88_005471 [Pleurodeles waltl]|uniref:Uncharacterized protein n=1 Tax=Pleurodeles waltl TaxID=8319 RepID=A0AAV7RM81_PLEWA|nr:hypothetical protein NDU88_005471 [Pleurodeles waltl]
MHTQPTLFLSQYLWSGCLPSWLLLESGCCHLAYCGPTTHDDFVLLFGSPIKRQRVLTRLAGSKNEIALLQEMSVTELETKKHVRD